MPLEAVYRAGRCWPRSALSSIPPEIRILHDRPKIDIYQIGVWFSVGFFTGAGWAIAGWLVGRILSVV
jgi:hypothetical protein